MHRITDVTMPHVDMFWSVPKYGHTARFFSKNRLIIFHIIDVHRANHVPKPLHIWGNPCVELLLPGQEPSHPRAPAARIRAGPRIFLHRWLGIDPFYRFPRKNPRAQAFLEKILAPQALPKKPTPPSPRCAFEGIVLDEGHFSVNTSAWMLSSIGRKESVRRARYVSLPLDMCMPSLRVLQVLGRGRALARRDHIQCKTHAHHCCRRHRRRPGAPTVRGRARPRAAGTVPGSGLSARGARRRRHGALADLSAGPTVIDCCQCSD
jgi:hypothetical protein